MLWYKILYYWGFLKKPLGSGLSIPFLVGAEIQYGINSNFSTDDLLLQFSKMNSKYAISIRYCDTIGELVCCLEEFAEEETKSHQKRFGNLVLIADYFNQTKTLDHVLLLVEKDFMPLIKKEKYSVSYGKWSSFSQNDVSMITNLIP